jgi:hypothetical protein
MTNNLAQRVAVTGHVDVPDETVEWIVAAITAWLRGCTTPDWRGITCLARGADQLFAQVVLALDGQLHVVLPAQDYERRVVEEANRAQFRQLLALADTVQTMDCAISSREAYLAASQEMLKGADRLLAVWDGRPSRNKGDSADVVRTAQQMQIPVTVIWPCTRESTAPGAAPDPAADRRLSGDP